MLSFQIYKEFKTELFFLQNFVTLFQVKQEYMPGIYQFPYSYDNAQLKQHCPFKTRSIRKQTRQKKEQK